MPTRPAVGDATLERGIGARSREDTTAVPAHPLDAVAAGPGLAVDGGCALDVAVELPVRVPAESVGDHAATRSATCPGKVIRSADSESAGSGFESLVVYG